MHRTPTARPPRAVPRACHGAAGLGLAPALTSPCACQASLLKPVELQPAADKMADFAAKFGPSWSQALAEGLVHNAVDACDVLGVDAATLNEQWAAAKEAGQLFKFGGGFYVGRLSAGITAMVTKSSDLLADLPKSLYGGFDALALSNGLDDSEKVRAAARPPAARPRHPLPAARGVQSAARRRLPPPLAACRLSRLRSPSQRRACRAAHDVPRLPCRGRCCSSLRRSSRRPSTRSRRWPSTTSSPSSTTAPSSI